MASPKKTPRRASRACEACKRRKVRCDSQPRCQQCVRLDLHCVYRAEPVAASGRLRIDAAKRGALIAQYRQEATVATTVDSLRSSLMSKPIHHISGVDQLLDPALLRSMLPLYVARVYPISPIMSEAEIQEYITRRDESNEAAMLIYAFAGVVTALANNTPNDSSTSSINLSLDEIIDRALQHYEPMRLASSPPSIPRIVACLFLEMVLLSLRRIPLAFFYLREAIALVQMLHPALETPEIQLDPPERARRQRLYWQCFIHERYIALVASMPICLDPLPTLPDRDPTISDVVEQGWNHIIQTFLLVDREFVGCWTGDRSRVTAEWVQAKHDELADNWWHFEVELLPTTQQADLVVTRQWLRMLTWQMAISNFLTTSDAASSEALSLALPVRLSSELRQFLARVSLEDVAIHGWGFAEKLFEITNTIADVVVHLPPGDDVGETRRRIEDVLFAKEFLFALPRVSAIHKEMLEEKLGQIRLLYGDDFTIFEG